MSFFAPIIFDNICSNHTTFSQDNELHPEFIEAVQKAFTEHSGKVVFVDFTSISPSERNSLANLMLLCCTLSEKTKKPFIMFPRLVVKEPLTAFIEKYPYVGSRYAMCNNDGAISFIGYEGPQKAIIEDFLIKGETKSYDEVLQDWGKNGTSVFEQEVSNGFLVKKDDSKQLYIPQLSQHIIREFLDASTEKLISKALLDHLAIVPCDHYIIDHSKIHTDSLILVGEALRESTRALDRLSSSLKRIIVENYDKAELIVVGNSLAKYTDLLGAISKCRALTVDELLKSDFSSKKYAVVLDAVCRSGISIGSLISKAKEKTEIVAAAALFSTKQSIFIAEHAMDCHVLHTIDVPDWKSEDDCPLCCLGVPERHITGTFNQEEMLKSFIDNAASIQATAYNFWSSVCRTSGLVRNGHMHLRDGAERSDYLYYMDGKNLLTDEKVANYIADILYLNIIKRLKSKRIDRQSIRYLVTKDSDSTKALCLLLADRFGGYLEIVPFSKDEIQRMKKDSVHWTERMKDLSAKMQSKETVLIDTGINTGWTLVHFYEYFTRTKINNAVTAVILDRHNCRSNKGVKHPELEDVVSFYSPELPVWEPETQCPFCQTEEIISEIDCPEPPLLDEINSLKKQLQCQERTYE